jgi:phosphoribosylanthranilate isomerase
MLYGGTGRKFDWNRLKGIRVGKPFFLSGGIEPGDAGLVKAFMKDPVAKDLMVVDINSRFEMAPGIKDMGKVQQFITELHT